MGRLTLVAIAGLSLSACGSASCPEPFENGSFVRNKMTGETYVVTDGDPYYSPINGSCTVMLFDGKQAVFMSAFAIEYAGRAALEERGDALPPPPARQSEDGR